jgi:hypothetical protein
MMMEDYCTKEKIMPANDDHTPRIVVYLSASVIWLFLILLTLIYIRAILMEMRDDYRKVNASQLIESAK